MSAAVAVLQGERLARRHEDRDVVAEATVALAAGDGVALTGPSGSGKTTLLQLLALLDRPSAGRVLVDGRDAWQASPRERARLRLARIGFVFQRSNLLPHLSARDNVSLPAWRLHGDRAAASRAAGALLARFGLAARAGAPAAVLSMGEAQRVAIARALINRPAVVLADEPTGSLDSRAAAAVLAALDEVRAQGTALLVATHDPAVAAHLPRALHLEDGRLRA
jgi:ABC-type lipoprotein export system ATPase subunit